MEVVLVVVAGAAALAVKEFAGSGRAGLYLLPPSELLQQ